MSVLEDIQQIQLLNEMCLTSLNNINTFKYGKIFKNIFGQTFTKVEKTIRDLANDSYDQRICNSIANLILDSIDDQYYNNLKKKIQNRNEQEIILELSELLSENIQLADLIITDSAKLKDFVILTPEHKLIIDQNSFNNLKEDLLDKIATYLINPNFVNISLDNLLGTDYYVDGNALFKTFLYKNAFNIECVNKLSKYKAILTLHDLPMTIMIGNLFNKSHLIYLEGEEIKNIPIDMNIITSLIEMHKNNTLYLDNDKIKVDGVDLTKRLSQLIGGV